MEASSTLDNGEVYPFGVIARYEFPARGDMPPLVLHWYDGGLKPPQPKDLEPGHAMGDVIYIGEKGTLMGHRLVPEAKMKATAARPRSWPAPWGTIRSSSTPAAAAPRLARTSSITPAC